MNKDKINSKIEDLEAELQELKLLANAPEQRTPKAGDVWQSEITGSDLLILGESKSMHTDVLAVTHHDDEAVQANYTYLGKFDEVYVKISDVRDALMHQCVLGVNSIPCADYEALRKLNIITD